MKRKPKGWEDGDDFGSDILGFGAYAFTPGGSGETKIKQIGFIRNDTSHRKNKPSNKRNDNHSPARQSRKKGNVR